MHVTDTHTHTQRAVRRMQNSISRRIRERGFTTSPRNLRIRGEWKKNANIPLAVLVSCQGAVREGRRRLLTLGTRISISICILVPPAAPSKITSINARAKSCKARSFARSFFFFWRRQAFPALSKLVFAGTLTAGSFTHSALMELDADRAWLVVVLWQVQR